MAILLISPEPWDAHAVSKHHYARTLAAEGHQVLFLDPPDPQVRQIRLEPVADQPGLTRVIGPRVAPGLRRMPAVLRRWLERRWLNQLERQAGCWIEVVWLFENSRFYDLRFAGDRLTIYHQVDLNQNFHPTISASSADICFCTSELILQRLLPHNPCCYRLQHGVSVSSISELPDHLSAHLRRGLPQVAYVGNLGIPYLDLQTIQKVVLAHPEVLFHFIGHHEPRGALSSALGGAPNLRLWGRVESSLIPTILKQMDILMLCYSQRYQAQVSNPHKLMEYLASGRVVVATYTEEYVQHSDFLAMTPPGTNESYPALFASVLARLPEFNAPERMQARRAFAAAHSYPAQLARIRTHLEQHGLSFPNA